MGSSDSESFTEKMFELIHGEPKIDEILKLLKLNIEPNSISSNKDLSPLFEKATNHIIKFSFINMHAFFAITERWREKYSNNREYFLLRDNYAEMQNELLHSLVVAKIGWIKYATYTLRRCLELVVHGAFVATSTIEGPEGSVNPFLDIARADLWHKLVKLPNIRHSDLKQFIDKKKLEGLSKGEAQRSVYRDFTQVYLDFYHHSTCEEHMKNKNLSKSEILLIRIPLKFRFICEECKQRAFYLWFERVPTFDLMVAILRSRLHANSDSKSLDIGSAYDELSSLMHPNARGHQHSQEYDASDITRWLRLLEKCLKIALVIYFNSLPIVGLHIPEVFEYVEKTEYSPARTNVEQMKSIFCPLALCSER